MGFQKEVKAFLMPSSNHTKNMPFIKFNSIFLMLDTKYVQIRNINVDVQVWAVAC